MLNCWCVSTPYKDLLLLSGGHLKMMMQKAREGCIYAKTNQQLTLETNIFSKVKYQCTVLCCSFSSPFYSDIKD